MHTCNPSHSRDPGRRIPSSRPVLANKKGWGCTSVVRVPLESVPNSGGGGLNNEINQINWHRRPNPFPWAWMEPETAPEMDARVGSGRETHLCSCTHCDQKTISWEQSSEGRARDPRAAQLLPFTSRSSDPSENWSSNSGHLNLSFPACQICLCFDKGGSCPFLSSETIAVGNIYTFNF